MKKFIYFSLAAALALLLAMPAGNVFAADYSQRGLTPMSRASNLIGATVKNDQGQALGKVSDLVIGTNGNLDYLVISQVPGAEGKLIPVPFNAAYIHTQPEGVVLRGINQAMLDKAPAFNQNDWYKVNMQSFDNEVRGYYGYYGGQQMSSYPRSYRGQYPEGYIGRSPRPMQPTPETQIGPQGGIQETPRNPWNTPPEGFVGPSPGSSGNTVNQSRSPGNW